MGLRHTFRWFGPKDPVGLPSIKQTGAQGIVTALHQVPCGEVWLPDAIKERQNLIESHGLSWDVVESLNVHDDVKRGSSKRDQWIEWYMRSLKNLADQNIKTVCYNFMPVLDWTRTDLSHEMEDGALALRFDEVKMAAFDLFILKRMNAGSSYAPSISEAAGIWFNSANENQKEQLSSNIMAGIPGTASTYELNEFKKLISLYSNIDRESLQKNLEYFLKAVIPLAESLGINMCIHPDDPPFTVLGLPRIVSVANDFNFIMNAVNSNSNGITLCTGSLGARADNDLPAFIKKFGSRIHFIHLRNVYRESNNMGHSFYEDQHLKGSTDMFEVMKAILNETMHREKKDSGSNHMIPMRPDHGHKLLDDTREDLFPGYSLLGRMKGLAELRGLEMGVQRSLFPVKSPIVKRV